MTDHELLEYCNEYLSYDPETGKIIWIKKVNRYSRIKIGSEAGGLHPGGAIRIQLGDRKYLAHRLAFLIHYYYLPKFIDHINGDRSDNRITNLRKCTNSQNSKNRGVNKNNTSGYKGVNFDRLSNKYKAQICVDGEKIYLGLHNSKHNAARVYNLAARMYHGYQFCHTNLISEL